MRDDSKALREKLEQWARWRHYRVSGELGWSRRDSLGRAISGMPSTRCPKCQGRGRIMAKQIVGAAMQYESCPVCSGAGRVRLDPDPNKVNPAFIRSTTGGGPYYEDAQSQRIDYIICTDLSEHQRNVIIYEYTRPGRQSDKAGRLGISCGAYEKRLARALEKIVKML